MKDRPAAQRPHDVGFREPFDRDVVRPAEAFSVLGNRTRLSILRALWEADTERLSFAELERNTAAETDNFAYHLDQLVDHFVRRTDDGYVLRSAGETVMRSVVAGLFSESHTLPRLEIGSECPFCAGSVEVQYVDDQLTARCMDCGGVAAEAGYPSGTFMNFRFPPAGLVGRSPSEVLEAAHVLHDAKLTPMMAGICPVCAATVGRTFLLCQDHEIGEDGLCGECDTRFSVWVEFVCARCAYQRRAPPWCKLLTEPAVIAFYHEHSDFDGRVPFSKLTSENAPYRRSMTQSVASTDPLRVSVHITLETAELQVLVDDELEIHSLEQTIRD